MSNNFYLNVSDVGLILGDIPYGVTPPKVIINKELKPNPKRHERLFFTKNDVNVILVGIPDLVLADHIEKHKVIKRSFTVKPGRQQVMRMQLYMFLCSKPFGTLVEYYKGKTRKFDFKYKEDYITNLAGQVESKLNLEIKGFEIP